MYATIRHCERGAASTDDFARAGYALATHLSKAPGFVAYVLVETPGGGHAAVCIFEDRDGLAAAEALVEGCSTVGPPAPRADAARRIMGEVVVQKGL
jgi:hypothetical protein